MSDSALPEPLQEFILKHIDSVAQLEALLLLRRSAEREWDASTAAKRLYSGVPETAEALARLAADGFLLTNGAGGYRYGCRTQEQQEMVDLLADHYARHLIPVTKLIHSKPRRIRAFADAFKLRKEP
jgi:FMN phosphatase YigB (HAD superfamily)